MTKYFYNTETGQTDGTPCTTALLPANGVSPTLTTSGTFSVQFKTAAAAQGALGIRSTATVSGSSVQIRFGASPTFSTADMQWDGTLNVAAYPSGPSRFFGLYSGGFTTFIGGLAMDATGHILVLNQPGSTVYTTVAVVPIGTTIRWNLRLRQGSTTSNGIIDFSYYATYAATTPTEPMPQITNANLSTFATNPITNAIKGKVTTTGTWSQWDMDADQFSTNPAVDGLITGPYSQPVSGSAAGTSSSSGDVTARLQVAGEAAAVSSASGAVAARAAVTGTAAAVTDSSGAVAALRPVAGTAAAVSAASGAVSVVSAASLAVSGTAAALSGASGAIAARAAVSGLAAALSGASGSVGSVQAVSGATAAASGSSGAVTSLSPVSGVAIATSGSSGVVLKLGPRVDIDVTASLAPRAWGAVLPARSRAARLPDRRADAALAPRRTHGALPARRWKGSL